MIEFLKDVVRNHLQGRYGQDNQEWKAACERALKRAPGVWREPIKSILEDLQRGGD